MASDGGRVSGVSTSRRADRLPLFSWSLAGVILCVFGLARLLTTAFASRPEVPGHDVASCYSFYVLVYPVWLMVRHWPPMDAAGTWRQARTIIAIHLLAALVFSGLWLRLTILMRKIVYGLHDQRYLYFQSDWKTQLVTDLAVGVGLYGVMLAVLSLYADVYGRTRKPLDKDLTPAETSSPLALSSDGSTPPASADEGFELSENGRVRRIVLGRLDGVTAEGNYMRLHLDSGDILVRRTLSDLKQQLEPYGFVQIHKSRLVPSRRIKEVRSERSGDFLVVLDNGRTVPGSRRYRAGLIDPNVRPDADS